MKKFRKWNDLQQFHEVTKNLNYPRIHAALKEVGFKIEYGFKVKLHGTNAAIRIEPDGKVIAQKRSSDITTAKDNAGFAKWVEDNEYYFSKLADSNYTTYIYGEWCGPGVQKGVACAETNHKYFYVFAFDLCDDEEFKARYYDPADIDRFLGNSCIDQVLVIPWHFRLTIDFLDKVRTQESLILLNHEVEKIGQQDPFMYSVFEIDGAGEGLVGYPLLGNKPGIVYVKDEIDLFSWFNFKAKSELHRVNKTPKAVNYDPEKFASIQLFADAYCTEARFEQGFTDALSRRKDMRLVPDFISWVVRDIYKESETERAVNPDLDWKAISKACSTRAVLWYKAKVQEL
jgi:hypothetical protein